MITEKPIFQDRKHAVNHWKKVKKNLDRKITVLCNENPKLVELFRERAIVSETLAFNQEKLAMQKEQPIINIERILRAVRLLK